MAISTLFNRALRELQNLPLHMKLAHAEELELATFVERLHTLLRIGQGDAARKIHSLFELQEKAQHASGEGEREDSFGYRVVLGKPLPGKTLSNPQLQKIFASRTAITPRRRTPTKKDSTGKGSLSAPPTTDWRRPRGQA